MTDSGMDDLISRAAAIKEIESIKYCGDFISALIHLPAVDAVPVAWLNQKYAENEPGEDKDYDYFLWNAIQYILTEWQKEQEAR